MRTAGGGNCSPINLPKVFLNSSARDHFVSSGAILIGSSHCRAPFAGTIQLPVRGDTIGLLDILLVDHSRERSIIASNRQIATHHALNTNFLFNEPLLLAAFCFGNAAFCVWDDQFH